MTSNPLHFETEVHCLPIRPSGVRRVRTQASRVRLENLDGNARDGGVDKALLVLC